MVLNGAGKIFITEQYSAANDLLQMRHRLSPLAANLLNKNAE